MTKIQIWTREMIILEINFLFCHFICGMTGVLVISALLLLPIGSQQVYSWGKITEPHSPDGQGFTQGQTARFCVQRVSVCDVVTSYPEARAFSLNREGEQGGDKKAERDRDTQWKTHWDRSSVWICTSQINLVQWNWFALVLKCSNYATIKACM